MAAQTGDELPASRSGIVGKITVQNIIDLVTQSDWNATSGAAEILNKPADIATLTNHYLKVSMDSDHLKGGSSRIDFDNATNTLVLGLVQNDIEGTFISFANNKFTVSEDGMYTFNVSAEFESLTTQRVMPAVTFKLNGTTIDGKSIAYVRQTGNADEGSINLSRTLILSSGDEIEVFSANQGLTSNSVVAPALMFMAEAYSNSMTVTGLDGDSFSLVTTLSEASSRSLVLTDKDKNIENSANITITVPTNASVAFSIGAQIAFTKKFESLTFAASGGVTINSVGNLLEMGRINCGAALLKIGANEWNLIGELV